MSFFKKMFGAGSQEMRKPKVIIHEAFSGAIRAFEVPTAEGWEYMEDGREGDGFSDMTLEYSIAYEDQRLVLVARIYTVAADLEPPTSPEHTDWAAEFSEMFSTIDNITTAAAEQRTMKKKVAAVEVTIKGSGSNGGGSILVRERRAVIEHEQFVVGAFGPPSAFEPHHKEIQAWFDKVAFVPIGDMQPKKT